MTSYFDEVVNGLSPEDTILLSVLLSAKATSKPKAIVSSKAMEAGDISEAIFRKLVNRLAALQFIEVSATFKENAIFLTPYGQSALLSLGLKQPAIKITVE